MLCIVVPLEDEPTQQDQHVLQAALDTEVAPSTLRLAAEHGWSLGELLTQVLVEQHGLDLSEDDAPEAADR